MKQFFTTIGMLILKISLSILCIGTGTFIIYQGHDGGVTSTLFFFITGAFVWTFSLAFWQGFKGWLTFWVRLLNLEKFHSYDNLDT